MSYLGGPFAHDVFISYSRGDQQKIGKSHLQQWSLGFADELKAELQLGTGFDALTLFIDQARESDHGVDLMAPLTEELRQKVAGSALVAVLLSQRYLDSEWCKLERDWWATAQRELQLPCERHVALVRILPIDNTSAKLPPPLADAAGVTPAGVWFYDRTKTAEARPYEWPFPESKSKGEFREALLQLTGQLRNRLRELKERLEERKQVYEDAARLTAATPTVYLHGRKADEVAWQAAYQELASSRFTVLPGEPEALERDPSRAQLASQERVRAMRGCDALLLVATDDERALNSDMAVVGRQERYQARATTNRLLPGAVLNMSASLRGKARNQEVARKLQLDWLDLPSTDWVDQIKAWLANKAQQSGAGV